MRDLAICFVLLVATFAVYEPVRHFEFVNYDDPEFVPPRGAALAFTSTESANWMPLTRLSYLPFGGDSGAQHVANVAIHALAAMALFAFLFSATGGRWPSAAVAMLFALHPLHVESVAWVAERKDVLCALFWFLSVWAYARSQRLLALLAFALGLMAKPMIVTLPVLLLLIDVWPLRRRPALWEKAPFFALSAVAALFTFFVQRAGGAVGGLHLYPPGLRVENALVSYALYLWQSIVPAGLAVFYPYPGSIPLWQPAVAAIVLAAITWLVFRGRATRPYLAVGWCWFLVTLLPVLGLVQIGAQARADRYMYVPLVGLAIMLAWSVPRPALIAVCLACAVMAHAQVAYWKNSETLFSHALAVTRNNYVAHHQLAVALQNAPGRLPEAIANYQAAIRIYPAYAEAHNNLGSAWAQLPGHLPDAIREFNEAIRCRPDFTQARANLFAAHLNYATQLTGVPGGLPAAVLEYYAALQLNSGYAKAHYNLAVTLAELGRGPEAIAEYHSALRIDPRYAEAHYNLGVLLWKIHGRSPEAISHLQTALALHPDPNLQRFLERNR